MFVWDFEWHIDQQMREKSPHPMLVWKAWSHPCVSSVHCLISMASITHSNSMQTSLLKWKKNAFQYLELIPWGIFPEKKKIPGSKDVYQVFTSVQLFSCVWLFATSWTVAHQASLSITSSQSLLKLMSVESMMPSNHLILCHPLLLLPSVFPSISTLDHFIMQGAGFILPNQAHILDTNLPLLSITQL